MRKKFSPYINHRLAVAGGAGRAFLSTGAEKEIYRQSRGVPRRINMLCDRAFLSAYLRGGAMIERADVKRAKESLSDSHGMGRRFLQWVPWVSPPLALLAALAWYGWMP